MVQGTGEEFGEVGARVVGPLGDPGAAAEAVREDDDVRCGGSDGGQQDLFTGRHG